MVKSYFLLYKRAKKLLDNNEVKLTNIIEQDNNTIYYFKANGHTTKLEVSKIDGSKMWQRLWDCDCASFSVYQDTVQCKHIVACESFLVNGGGDIK